MRRRCRPHSRLHLPRLWQDWPRTCRPAANGWPKLWQGRRKAMNFRPKWENRSRKVENDGASPRERCRSPSQRGGIPVPPRLHTAPTVQDRGETAGNWWFSSYVILHFLRTGVAPRGEVSNGVFALRLGKCFSALFFAMCTKKRGRPRFASAKLWPSSTGFNTLMWVFFDSLLYIFAFMRLFLVIRVNLNGEMRFFVGTIHGLRRILFDLVGAEAQ